MLLVFGYYVLSVIISIILMILVSVIEIRFINVGNMERNDVKIIVILASIPVVNLICSILGMIYAISLILMSINWYWNWFWDRFVICDHISKLVNYLSGRNK